MRRSHFAKLALALIFCFSAEPGRVIDGDTFWVLVHKYPRETRSERVRLLGVQTPERGKPGYAEAKAFAEKWLKAGAIELCFSKYDDFGRLLGSATRGDENLNNLLLQSGHAVQWTGKP